MRILGIETSCDETALALINADTTNDLISVSVEGDELYSQVELHKQYGGVFPMLAKREHAKNLIPLFTALLKKTGHAQLKKSELLSVEKKEAIQKILFRESELKDTFIEFVNSFERPPIDAIAVTYGPGLEPALWVGLNFAYALKEAWGIEVIPVNHMEGHIVSTLFPKADLSKKQTLLPVTFPLLALLISGGHTELVLAKDWFSYKIIGETRDDALGEAFDKVARILGLPYPGGPEISRLASKFRLSGKNPTIKLPRPMIESDNLDFSFSGLKTAVLYMVKKLPELTEELKMEIACEFENAVVDVLLAKTKKAVEHYGPKIIAVGGGVIANELIRTSLKALTESYADLKLYTPHLSLTTDNAIMIALAGYIRRQQKTGLTPYTHVAAHGNLRLPEE
jgi:N6-L-threonylcarbamoyladenine synthase